VLFSPVEFWLIWSGREDHGGENLDQTAIFGDCFSTIAPSIRSCLGCLVWNPRLTWQAGFLEKNSLPSIVS